MNFRYNVIGEYPEIKERMTLETNSIRRAIFNFMSLINHDTPCRICDGITGEVLVSCGEDEDWCTPEMALMIKDYLAGNEEV